MSNNDDEIINENDSLFSQEKSDDYDFAATCLGEDEMHAFEAHVQEYIGEVTWILHENISEDMHIDILVVEPTPARDYYTLLTMGMSASPMNVPEDMDISPFSELMIYLPPDWVVPRPDDVDATYPDESDPAEEENYWPIHWLKILAHLPVNYDTWLGYAHSIPTGKGFTNNTELNSFLLSIPLEEEDFFTLSLENDKEISFWNIVPVYEEELQYKIENGADSLFELFDQFEISAIVDISRPNVVLKEAEENEYTRPN